MLVISSIHGMQFFNSPSSSSKSILRFISKTDAYSTKCQLGSDQWYFAWGSLRAGFFKDSPSTLIDSALYMFWFQYGLCFWMHCDYVTITDGNFNNNIDMLIFTESVRKIIRWGHCFHWSSQWVLQFSAVLCKSDQIAVIVKSFQVILGEYRL